MSANVARTRFEVRLRTVCATWPSEVPGNAEALSTFRVTAADRDHAVAVATERAAKKHNRRVVGVDGVWSVRK